METKKCTLCNFETDNKKIFANHVRWKHKEKPFSDEALKKLRTKKVFKIKKECKCNKCEKFFEKELYDHEWRKLDRNQGGRTYCSITCAKSHSATKSIETISKIKKSLNKFHKNNNKNVNKHLICKKCLKQFEHIKKILYCSKECYRESRKRKTKDIRAYRNECKFKFSLRQYPEEFDFELIKKYGMYKAKNHGNNPSGVSRDHMVSVKYGFVNNIDPKIIAHPANCKLILQEENFKKREECSITIEELTKRIDEWNKKYGGIV